MKKKMLRQILRVSLFFSIYATYCVASDIGIINIADQAPAPAPAPSAAPPPAPEAAPTPQPIAAPPTPAPQDSAQSEAPKIDYNKPLLAKSQSFHYRCLNASNVTLHSLKTMDCERLQLIYEEDPQRAVDHVSLLILVNRVLQGANVYDMPQQDRIDLAYATILGELRKYGRVNELRGYMGLSFDECRDRLEFPSVGALCQILEGVKGAIILELYHFRLIFPKA